MISFSPLVAIALLGFVPFGLLLFAFLPARRAVAAIYVLGWVFLPPAASYKLPGLPDYNKFHAIMITAMLGSVLFDMKTLMRFRPQWADIPAFIFMFVPFFSSITNGLGVNDGLSSMFQNFSFWVAPYFLGRVYFSDLPGIREFALWIFIGALICMPLCWIEMKMSPQLNRWVYGYHQHPAFDQTRRYGGWRPMLFMQHGLMVGLWMSVGTMMATIFWMSGAVKKFLNIPMSVWTALLALTTVMCRSFGALALLALALAIASIARQIRVPILVGIFALMPVAYVATRSTGLWDGMELVSAARQVGGEQRGGSLEYRIKSENALVQHALKQPVFGWGGWDRNRPDRKDVGYRIATDGLWVIQIGQRGLVGLICFMSIFLIPSFLFFKRWGMTGVTHPWLAPGLALSLAVLMFLTDSLFNSMINPIYTVAAGAISGLILTPEIRAALANNMALRQARQAMTNARSQEKAGLGGATPSLR